MGAIEKLKKGFAEFQNGEFREKATQWKSLVEDGQRPKICVVACSDSRVDPAILLGAEPGDLFMIRNVANLVHPEDESGSYQGTNAALEYAVEHLKVEHILVIGHAFCGGIGSLFGPEQSGEGFNFIPSWMSVAKTAHQRVMDTIPDADESTQHRACEKEGVKLSLENLMTFDYIRKRVDDGSLNLHGWHVDIGAGNLSCYNADTNQFELVDE
mgnify:CR=1 FL=1